MLHQRKFYVIYACPYIYRFHQYITILKSEQTKKRREENNIFSFRLILLMNLYEFMELVSIVFSRFYLYLFLSIALFCVCFFEFFHGAIFSSPFMLTLLLCCYFCCFCCCCCDIFVVGGWLKEA